MNPNGESEIQVQNLDTFKKQKNDLSRYFIKIFRFFSI